MRTGGLPGGEHQAILAITLALVACGAVSASTTNIIAGASPAAGDLTLALSFYAALVFCLHATQGMVLARPATIRRRQVLVLLCATAISAWIVVFPDVNQIARTIAAFVPAGVLAGLILGPWHGLLPASAGKQEDRVFKKERSDDDEQ